MRITNPDQNQWVKAGHWAKRGCPQKYYVILYSETCKKGSDEESANPSHLPYQLKAGQGNFAHIHWTSFCNVDKPRFQNCHSTRDMDPPAKEQRLLSHLQLQGPVAFSSHVSPPMVLHPTIKFLGTSEVRTTVSPHRVCGNRPHHTTLGEQRVALLTTLTHSQSVAKWAVNWGWQVSGSENKLESSIQTSFT